MTDDQTYKVDLTRLRHRDLDYYQRCGRRVDRARERIRHYSELHHRHMADVEETVEEILSSGRGPSLDAALDAVLARARQARRLLVLAKISHCQRILELGRAHWFRSLKSLERSMARAHLVNLAWAEGEIDWPNQNLI